MKSLLLRSAFLFSLFICTNIYAAPMLIDWAFNIDGEVSENTAGDAIPAEGVLDANGFGELTLDITTAGAHNIVSFFDFEIDQATNTFFNEYGLAAGGAPEAGQSWEIDEPGFVFGDIYDNVLLGSLDNTNAVPAGQEDDVSLAMAWNFVLGVNQQASITFNLSDTNNAPGFYLAHVDEEAGPSFDQTSSVFFWSSLEITTTTDPTVSVSEPSSIILSMISLLMLLVARWRAILNIKK